MMLMNDYESWFLSLQHPVIRYQLFRQIYSSKAMEIDELVIGKQYIQGFH